MYTQTNRIATKILLMLTCLILFLMWNFGLLGCLFDLVLSKLFSVVIILRCACNIMVRRSEREIGVPSSNSRRDHCYHFRANTLGNYMNPSLLYCWTIYPLLATSLREGEFLNRMSPCWGRYLDYLSLGFSQHMLQ